MEKQEKVEEIQLDSGEAAALELCRVRLRAASAEAELYRMKAEAAANDAMTATRGEAALTINIGAKYKLGHFKALRPLGGGKVQVIR